MNQHKKHPTRFVIFITLLGALLPIKSLANCQISPHELQFYVNTGVPKAPIPYTQVAITSSDTNPSSQKTASFTITRANTPQPVKKVTVSNIKIQLTNTNITNPNNAPQKKFVAFILPPGASSLSVRQDIPPKPITPSSSPLILPGNHRERYEASSLGDKGAIIFFEKTAIETCAAQQTPFYLLPSSSIKDVDSNIPSSRFITLDETDFNNVLKSLLSANNNHAISANTLEQLFDHTKKGSTAASRSQMFYSPIEITFNKELEQQLLHSNSSNNKVLSLPLWSDWRDEAEKLIQPDSIIRMRQFTGNSVGFFIELSELETKIRNNTATDSELKQFLDDTENVIVEGSAIYSEAKKELDNLQALADTPPPDMNLVTSAAMMHREVTGFKFSIEQTRTRYETIYARYHKLPPLRVVGGIDEQQLRSADLNLNNAACKLTAQEVTGPVTSLNISGKHLNIPTRLFVNYRNFKDPIYKKELIRPYFTLLAGVSGLHSIHQQLLKENIPASSCRHRYRQEGGVSTQASKGRIEGRSQVRYEKWVCEDYKFICWDWGPKTCRKHIKTRVFSSGQSNYFTMYAGAPHKDEIKIFLESRFINSNSKVNLIPNHQSDAYDFLKTSMGLNWTGSSFNHIKGKPSDLLLHISGKGKALRINTACSLHKEVSELSFK